MSDTNTSSNVWSLMATSSSDPLFSFLSGGKEISLRKSSITAERLARHFQFDPTTVYVQEEFGNRVEFPNESGKINMNGFLDGTSFLVLGDNATAHSSSGLSTSTTTQSSFSTLACKPVNISTSFSSGGNKGKSSKGAKATVKVVYAEMSANGKPQPSTGYHAKQTFVPIYRDEEANVDYISSFVTNIMNEKVVLVGNNGIQYKDEPGTRGIAFWKMGSRKVYAVAVNKKKRLSDTESDDSDREGQSSKKARIYQKKRDKEIMEAMSGLKEKVDEIQATTLQLNNDVSKVLKLDASAKVPLSLKSAVSDTFMCKICSKIPMETPILASRCCNSILGCAACVQTWFAQDGSDVFEKACPYCRTERGYSNTFRLVGIDDFLNSLKDIMSG